MSKLKLYILSFLLTVTVAVVLCAVFAVIALNGDAGNSVVGIAAAAAVFIGTAVGAVFSAKKGECYDALITAAIVFCFISAVSLITEQSEYALPFAVPVCIAVSGILSYLYSAGKKRKVKAKIPKSRTKR